MRVVLRCPFSMATITGVMWCSGCTANNGSEVENTTHRLTEFETLKGDRHSRITPLQDREGLVEIMTTIGTLQVAYLILCRSWRFLRGCARYAKHQAAPLCRGRCGGEVAAAAVVVVMVVMVVMMMVVTVVVMTVVVAVVVVAMMMSEQLAQVTCSD